MAGFLDKDTRGAAAPLGEFADAFAAEAEPPNVERAKQVMRKSQAGETLTPEEQSCLDRVRTDVCRRAAAKGITQPPTPHANAPAPDQHRQKTGKMCRSTPPLALGRLHPQ